MEWSQAEALGWVRLCKNAQWPKSPDISHPQHSEQRSVTDVSQLVSTTALRRSKAVWELSGSIGRVHQKVERALQSDGQNQRLLAGIQAKQDDKGGWVMSPPTAASVWPEPSRGAAPLDQQLPTHLPIFLGGLTVLSSQAVGRAGHPELALQCVSTKDSAHLISIAG